MGSEDWRLRRADELFGSGRLTPGEPPREPAAAPIVREPVAPTGRAAPPTPPVDRTPPVAAEAPAVAPPRPAYRAPPPAPVPERRRAAWLWAALLAVAGLICGVLIGWFARSPSRVAVDAVPRIAIAPPALVPLPRAAVPVPKTPAPELTTPAPIPAPAVAEKAAPSPPAPKPAKPVVVGAKAKPVRPAGATPALPVAPRRVRKANAPSFDCRRNRGAVMRAICGDPALAALDRQLSARFAALDARVDPATVQRIHRGETAFLNDRQSCPDRACLVAAYRSRLRELASD